MALITLAILGGSSVATPACMRALLEWEGRPEMRIVLLGRSEQKLAAVSNVCARMAQDARPGMSIEATTDVRAGLWRVDYVLNQVRVGGLEAREHDETFPQKLGLPGEETVAPGGFANALRTLPVVLTYMQLIGEVAPDAIVLNLTNPAGIVQYAAERYTHANVISLCDSPIALTNELSRLVQRSGAEVACGYFGMNHLGWVVSLCDAERDLMDLALERVDAMQLGVDASFIRASRAIPLPYARFYLHPERVLEQQQGRMPRGRQLQLLEQDLLTQYARLEQEASPATAAATAVAKRGAVWYAAIIVPLLDALVNGRALTLIASVRNTQLIPWLPPQTIVEVPCRVHRQGLQALPVPEYLLAPELRTLLFSLALYEELAVSAIAEQKRDTALRALVAHPLVRTLQRAEAVLRAVWPDGGI
jgi:6-phospho-beta-glucosidase